MKDKSPFDGKVSNQLAGCSVVSEDEEFEEDTGVVEVASTTEAVNSPWTNARTAEGLNWSTLIQPMQSVIDPSALTGGDLSLASFPVVGCCTPGSRSGAISSTQLREVCIEEKGGSAAAA